MAKKIRKAPLYILAGFVLILIIAVMTNPTPERHKEAIKEKVKVYAPSLSETDNGLTIFGQILSGAIIDRVIDNVVSVDNYVVFSLTKLNWEDETYIVGGGAFGNVYISKKVDEILDENIDEFLN